MPVREVLVVEAVAGFHSKEGMGVAISKAGMEVAINKTAIARLLNKWFRRVSNLSKTDLVF